MTTRAIIRAVPWRAEGCKYLAARLPHAEWVFDRHHNAMDTFIRGLEKAGMDPAIHIEDDALLVADFVPQSEAVIAAHPDRVIQFFSRRQADLTIGSRFESVFSSNVCYYLPAGYAPQILEFLPGWMQRNPQHPTGYDLTIDAWLKTRRERHWIHVPNLADHRVAVSAISAKRARRRVSLTFPGAPE